MNLNLNFQAGFVALTSVIVISALLIIIGASLGYTGFFSRFNILDGEFKEISLGLAEACAEIARVEIAKNPNYTVNSSAPVTKTVDGNPCQIISVSGSYTVQTRGEKEGSISNIEAVFSRTTTDVTVSSWKEVPNF